MSASRRACSSCEIHLVRGHLLGSRAGQKGLVAGPSDFHLVRNSGSFSSSGEEALAMVLVGSTS